MKLALEAAVLAAIIGLGAVEIAHTEDPASATQAANPSVAAPDIKFLESAARYANADIQLGQIAQTQSSIPEVKAFAQQIITLQQAHLQALDKLAKNKGIVLPTEPDAEALTLAKHLKTQKSPMFEHDYLSLGVAKKKLDAQTLYMDETEHGKDADIKSMAQTSMPILDDQLSMARKLLANSRSE
ncbi:DUF4142 domain-containing protein [Amantichitinum ursilacus]|uniref:DUF4142 domain-containing protein n=1 Tax=Amantichitinum ursilacus TaxID=857265 RepID=A0A0N0XLN4_9NEIS|nr:DUF4142 domain-containing protein [Amantichitinum ursilacus]KPC53906.1 hypothetical protein WG78_07280 [Amantichitinum ursilacus]